MTYWITTGDAMRLYRVSKSTIRRWAREDAWRKRTTRPVTYRWEDVQASYEKRHVNPLRSRLVQRHQDTIDHIAGRP